MAKVSFASSVGSYRNDRAELTKTTHPKGGDAWDVTIAEQPAGVLRRFTCNEETVTMTRSSASWSKRRVTRWAAYPPSLDGDVRVFSSRAAALRFMRDEVPRG